MINLSQNNSSNLNKMNNNITNNKIMIDTHPKEYISKNIAIFHIGKELIHKEFHHR